MNGPRMTPLQRIEAALAWLGELRAGATPGPWHHDSGGLVLGPRDTFGAFPLVASPGHHETQSPLDDAALIVAVTHPAVLDAVEAVLRRESDMRDTAWSPDPKIVELAAALLTTKSEGTNHE